MGIAGAGKSTVGRCLADELGWPFFDGDDFHPAANVDKMRQGIALTDADRYVINGKMLELYKGEALLARFEAQNR